jgi:hypothetical protein
MWMEIGFNSAYLITIWGLVVVMVAQQSRVDENQHQLARYFFYAFALLALGDTGHVGFRIVGYSLGNLEASLSLGSMTVSWVGLGALSTAITVTLFYVFMLLIWKERFNQSLGWFGALLILSAVVRLIVMMLPGNDWNAVVPPRTFSLIRNLPLTISGLGVAYLILRDSIRANDRLFRWIGVMILVSYAFYLPVILFVQQVPVIGMLMIPKTLAYVAIAILAYRSLWLRGEEGISVSESSVPA